MQFPAVSSTRIPVKPANTFFGLLRQRTCWVPTPRAWIVLFLLVLVGGIVIVEGIHPFLSPNEPLPGGAVVVEGWADDFVLKEAIRQVEAHHYHPVFITGGTMQKGSPFSEFGTMAEFTSAEMRQLSKGTIEPQAVPTPDVRKDRTFSSAIALRAWMEAHGGILPEITVVSAGPHSRRSRLLFEKAFGNSAHIGIVACPAEGYDPNHWWTYSEGFRSVVSEAVAYAYARLVFWRSS